MLEPVIITSIGIGAAALGSGAALRNAFARSLNNKACDAAEKSLQEFKNQNNFLHLPKNKFIATLSVLHTTLQTSRAMRESMMNEFESMNFATVSVPWTLESIPEKLGTNHKIWASMLSGTYKHKIEHIYIEQVKHRFDLIKEALAQKAKADAAKAATMAAAAVAGTAGAAQAAGVDDAESLAQIYQNLSKESLPNIDAFRDGVVDILDQFGVIDGTVDTLLQIDEFIKKQAGDMAGEYASFFTDIATDFHAFPGALSGIQSMFGEIELLMADENSIGDIFKSGFIPIFFKAVGLKLGIALDAATAGLSMGAFTAAGNAAAKFASDAVLEMQNKEYRKKLEELANEIASYKRRVERIVNNEVCAFQKEFDERIKACPDINENRTLNDFITSIKEAYNKGYHESEKTLSENLKKTEMHYPQDNWVDKILGISRKSSVKRLFLEAQREITARHDYALHRFCMAAETHAEDGVNFMMNNPLFAHADLDTALKKVEKITFKIAKQYEQALSGWQKETNEFYKESVNKLAETTKTQSELFREFAQARQPEMKELRRKIKSNNYRQKKISKEAAFSRE